MPFGVLYGKRDSLAHISVNGVGVRVMINELFVLEEDIVDVNELCI